MFTGCNVNNLFSTSVVYVAKDGQEISDDLIKALNESKFANAVPGHSDLYSNDPDKCKKAVQNQLNGTNLLSNITGAKDVEVESAALSEKEDENGKKVYFIKAVLKKKTSTSTNG